MPGQNIATDVGIAIAAIAGLTAAVHAVANAIKNKKLEGNGNGNASQKEMLTTLRAMSEVIHKYKHAEELRDVRLHADIEKMSKAIDQLATNAVEQQKLLGRMARSLMLQQQILDELRGVGGSGPHRMPMMEEDF